MGIHTGCDEFMTRGVTGCGEFMTRGVTGGHPFISLLHFVSLAFHWDRCNGGGARVIGLIIIQLEYPPTCNRTDNHPARISPYM